MGGRTVGADEVVRRHVHRQDDGSAGLEPKVTDEQLAVIRRMSGEGQQVAAIARATSLTRPTIYNYLPR